MGFGFAEAREGMTSAQVYESLVSEIGGMERAAMVERLLHFEGPVRLDFTQEYLEGRETEYLRHLLMAAMWRAQMRRGEGA